MSSVPPAADARQEATEEPIEHITAETLERWLDLYRRGTKKPWWMSEWFPGTNNAKPIDFDCVGVGHGEHGSVMLCGPYGDEGSEIDAALVTELVNATPSIVAEIKRLQAVNESHSAYIELMESDEKATKAEIERLQGELARLQAAVDAAKLAFEAHAEMRQVTNTQSEVRAAAKRFRDSAAAFGTTLSVLDAAVQPAQEASK